MNTLLGLILGFQLAEYAAVHHIGTVEYVGILITVTLICSRFESRVS